MPGYFRQDGKLKLDPRSVGEDCRNEDGTPNMEKLAELGIRAEIALVPFDKEQQDKTNVGSLGIQLTEDTLQKKLEEYKAKARLEIKEEMSDLVDTLVAAKLKSMGVNSAPEKVVGKARRGKPKGSTKVKAGTGTVKEETSKEEGNG